MSSINEDVEMKDVEDEEDEEDAVAEELGIYIVLVLNVFHVDTLHRQE